MDPILLFTTEHYMLQLVTEWDGEDDDDGPYQIVNVETQIVEYAGTVYPGALEMLYRYETAIDGYEKALHEHNESKAPTTMAEQAGDPERDRVLRILDDAKKKPKAVTLNAYRILEEDK